MNESKRQLANYFENISLLVIGLFLLLLPVFFLSKTTDAFVLPKEVALAGAVTVFAIFFGLKNIVEAKLRLRASPFDIPVILIVVVSLLSAVFSQNRYDALIGFAPLLLLTFFYFAVTNAVRLEKHLLFMLSCLMLGGVLSALISITSFFKVYLLPFPYTHVQYFTTFGSLLDQAIYFALILPISAYFIYPLIRSLFSAKHLQSPFATNPEHPKSKQMNGTAVAFAGAFLVILVSLGLTVYMLFTTQKPLILPFDTGLQTGFAAISQDSGSVLKSFLLGSGIGTYVIDFTRFKAAAYNANASLWSFTFFRSSSYVLEILATTGVLGIASFLLLFFKIFKEKNYFLPLILAVIAGIILPFSFTLVALFFILLAIFGVIRMHNNPEKYGDMEFFFVALKRGLLVARPETEGAVSQNNTQRQYNKFLPILFLVLTIVVVGVPMYFATIFFLSDMTFQQSLVAASQNNGLQTYNLEIAAIKIFPYRDIYYRTFAQTNIALANSLAVNLQKNPKTANAQQAQQNILTLIQQGISAGRNATTVAPYTSFNWNNLSSIYRSLIGFGQNADKFTVLTLQQAIALDPNNPQQYVDLGGVYYQLGQFDDAIRQFQLAINLKQDYANAYYNVGHAYEAKGDLQDALTAYQNVKTLVAADPTNSGKIQSEIDALNNKISQQGKTAASANAAPSVTPAPQEQAQPLGVNKAQNQLPERKPPVQIPAPSISPVVSPAPTTGQ